MNAVVLVVLGVVVLGIAVLLVLGHLGAKKRRGELEAMGLTMGFRYAAEDRGLVAELSSFEVLGRGHSREACNVLSGSLSGLDVRLADYTYVISSGNHRATHQQTVCVLRSRDLSLPHSLLRREIKVFDAVRERLGGQDIDIPDDPEFSSAFVLQGEDPAAVVRLYGQAVRAHVKRFAGQNVEIETRGDTMILHRGELVRPEALRELSDQGIEVLAALRNGTR